MKKSIETICKEIELYEAIRDNSDSFSQENKEYLDVLYTCYDLLANSQNMRNDKDNYSILGELADETAGEKPTESTYKYSTIRNELVDLILVSLDKEGVAGWVRRTREKLGYSKYRLAKELGISHTQIGFWEVGTNMPAFERIVQIYRLSKKI